MNYSLIALVALALSNGFIFILSKKNRFYKKEYEVLNAYRESTILSIAILQSERDAFRIECIKLRSEIQDLKDGWKDATYTNCTRKYGAWFRLKHSKKTVNDRIIYFMAEGINFYNIGIIPYTQLQIRIPA